MLYRQSKECLPAWIDVVNQYFGAHIWLLALILNSLAKHPRSSLPLVLLYSSIYGAWWLIGRFYAFHLKGCWFESRASRHVGTFGMSFTLRCMGHFDVKLRAPVLGAPVLGVDLKRRYRNCLSELMNRSIQFITLNSNTVSMLCRGERLWAVVNLKRRYKNILNEWTRRI